MSRLLLIDDDSDLRPLLRSALVQRGFEVVEASRLREAEGELRNGFDVIVVDGLLPDGSGIDFIEQFREEDSQTAVVFFSAFFRDLHTLRRLTEDLGVSLVFYKPLDPAGFAGQVADLVAGRPGVQTRGDSLPPAPDASLEVLQRDFAARLYKRVVQIEEAVLRARGQEETDISVLEEARMLAHRLRGSAGTFGYGEVGSAAGVIEDLIVEIDPDRPIPRYFWQEIGSTMRDLRLAASRAPHHISGASRRGARAGAVLVVDDDAQFLRRARTAARKTVMNVVTAESAHEALQRAQAQPLVAAIVDVHLGQPAEGMGLVAALREQEGRASLPIALMSADPSMQIRIAAVKAGASRFIDKPSGGQELGETLQLFLRAVTGDGGRALVLSRDDSRLAVTKSDLEGAGYSVVGLSSPQALIRTLEEVRPEILICDEELSGVSGLEICQALRLCERWQFLPVMVIVDEDDPKIRAQAFAAGAADVFAMPIVREMFVDRVRLHAERYRALQEKADRDPLSGLWLRRHFLDALESSIASCDREGQPLSLALIDLDGFKAVNDDYGHAAGDQVIARFGQFLLDRFRVDDLRARWGGEEFILVFPRQTAEFTDSAARRLLEDFSSEVFHTTDGRAFRVTFTAGVATFPRDGSSITALIQRADMLLYEGKKQGRNRVVGVSPGDLEPERKDEAA